MKEGIVETVTPNVFQGQDCYRVVVVTASKDWFALELLTKQSIKPGDQMSWEGAYAYWSRADSSIQGVGISRVPGSFNQDEAAGCA